MRLVNRRFVPFYFDLFSAGAAGDRDARAFVVRSRPDLGRMSVPTPPVLVMTPAGKVMEEVDNYATEEEMLASLRAVLGSNPSWNRPSQEEKALEDRARTGDADARLAFAEQILDLGEGDRARAELALAIESLPAGEERDRAAYLLGHAARLAGDFDAMEAAFRRIEDAKWLDDDLAVERAHRSAAEGRHDAVVAALSRYQRVPPRPRSAEALYLLGVAVFQRGEKEKARGLWESIVGRLPEDPWVYRADWALFNLAEPGRRTFSTLGERTPLGRIGYMGRENPDLRTGKP